MLKEITKNWSNKDNHALYKKMTPQEFIVAANRSGISNGEDVDQIKDLILHAGSILEIGSGYGRVLKHICGFGYSGSLEAIEYDRQYYDFCQERYSNKAVIHHADILSWVPQKKYDLVLWMWTSIAEFTPEEQKNLFKSIADMINPNGYLILEMKEPSSDDLDRIVIDGNRCKFLYNLPGGDLYVPSHDELMQYASGLFKDISVKKYMATGDVERTILRFRRSF